MTDDLKFTIYIISDILEIFGICQVLGFHHIYKHSRQIAGK